MVSMHNCHCLTLSVMLLMLGVSQLHSQDPLRFETEIEELLSDDNQVKFDTDLIVFTGSSSIRLWHTLHKDFPEFNLLNRGFGGSEMSDLLFYCDKLILQYQPKKVFIYEGDNDLNEGEDRADILREAKLLVNKIRAGSPETEIYFISAKPSIARLALKSKYEQFNYALSLWALIENGVTFIDIWTPMFEEDGTLSEDLFVEDQLHMNDKGYQIWKTVIAPYVEE